MVEPSSITNLGSLVSEARNPRTMGIDLLSVPDLLACINEEDRVIAAAVQTELPVIAAVVEAVIAAFRAGGRLVYTGAGTSGRLGVLDASECPPTFSVPPEMVVGIIAGGDTALRNAIEGAEDDAELGKADLAAIDVCAKDVVVGIAVSGRTPYVIGALNHALAVGATTVSLTCNPNSEMAALAAHSIAPVVGPEVITGSTRLKSGTAQKMVLNMITTAAMIRLGKTYQNLMVDLSISNRKLRMRAINMLTEITGISAPEAETLLAKSGDDVKLAICMEMTGLDRASAAAHLDQSDGSLRQAIAKLPEASA
jgi:N-acetylmuramic acid 6-phosphate etherase